ncbi:hypothetical protein N9118_11720 [Akkermansiaceae bacterium]|nr:hypothetical protein [Akkermansiaceae bacterium]
MTSGTGKARKQRLASLNVSLLKDNLRRFARHNSHEIGVNVHHGKEQPIHAHDAPSRNRAERDGQELRDVPRRDQRRLQGPPAKKNS